VCCCLEPQLCGFKFSNEVWIIDLSQGGVQVLDFTAELEAIQEGRTHCTAMCYSDEMNTLFVGTNAGKIFVRRVSVDERTRRLRVKLLKKGASNSCVMRLSTQHVALTVCSAPPPPPQDRRRNATSRSPRSGSIRCLTDL
jgi:hypothetical protein